MKLLLRNEVNLSMLVILHALNRNIHSVIVTLESLTSYTPTHTYVSAHMVLQSNPTPEFQLTKIDRLIPFLLTISSQYSPFLT
jgi:hypothetical protein